MSEQPNHRNPFFEKVDEDPEYEVGKVLKEIGWDGLSLPIDLIEICDMYGFAYQFTPCPEMEEKATVEFYGQGDFKIIINTYDTDKSDDFSENAVCRRRQRFSLAHEIGHCIYASHTDVALQQNLQNPSNPHSKSYIKRRENQANQFAAHLLIPRKAFDIRSRKFGWDDIDQLIQFISETFDVSYQVALQQTAVLADFPCLALLFKRNGSLLRMPSFSPDFKETKLFYPKWQNAPEKTGAKKLLGDSIAKDSVRKRYRDASDWFPNLPEWKTEKYEIIEISIPLGKYGVGTFLEINELDEY